MFNKLVLFSAVEGRVTREGTPVAKARLRRTFDWAWGVEKGEDETVTDASGRFSFPAIERSSMSASLVPHQPSINQTILIEENGVLREGWVHQKTNYANNGELKRPLRLACDYRDPDLRHEEHYGFCELG